MAERFIRRTFTSLIRHLQLDGSTPPMWLTDRVVPVVVLHQHLEDEVFTAFATAVGATQVNFSLPSVGLLRAGTYRIMAVFCWSVAVAAAETVQILILDRAGTSLLTLATIQYGFTGRLVGEIVLDYTVNLPEGCVVNLICSTGAVGDQNTGSLVVQQR